MVNNASEVPPPIANGIGESTKKTVAPAVDATENQSGVLKVSCSFFLG